jgi:hypothetical protein
MMMMLVSENVLECNQGKMGASMDYLVFVILGAVGY